jgi:tryptophanyl-tRNA synthetase
MEDPMTKKIVLSGTRSTGNIHLGNYFGALGNWVRLQDEYDCHFFIADWHALTTGYADTAGIKDNIYGIYADYLACGLDPERSVLFLQSAVKEHAELHLLLSMNTPLSWLLRCPTYKDYVAKNEDEGSATYGFLGYPNLQAADILMYRADFVPVGEDQLPHLELTREIARRFNHFYGDVLPEPQPLLTQSKVLPGIDGRKMSKSYGNTIAFADDPETVRKKTMSMVTDPARIRKDDPGHPEVCSVFAFHKVFSEGETEPIAEACRAGTVGCVQCKKDLAAKIAAFHTPIHEKRTALLQNRPRLREMLMEGSRKASRQAGETMGLVRSAMKVDF